MAWERRYRWGLCGSAGVTAGMASLAACSTLRRRLFESMEGHGDRKRRGGHAGPPLQGMASDTTPRAQKKQTTENTEDTERGREGAGTLHGIYAARRPEVERAVVRAGWRWNSRSVRDCVALPA